MFGADFVHLPVHAGRALIEHLHAIHADIALARVRIVRKDQRQRDIAPAVLRPAVQDRQVAEIDIIAGQHDFLAAARRRGRDAAASSRGRQLRQKLFRRAAASRPAAFPASAILRSRRRFDSKSATPSAMLMRFREPKALITSGMTTSSRVFKQQSRTAVRPLHHSVGDLRDFEIRGRPSLGCGAVHRRAPGAR